MIHRNLQFDLWKLKRFGLSHNVLAWYIFFDLLGPLFKSKPQGLINYGGACYKI